MAEGEYLAVFDADFQPKPEFLRQTIPHFHREPELGLIQARWGHLNADSSNLVAAQSIALDKHFALEQTVWLRANLYPKFNGSAGIWKRDCIEAVGGWHHDTVCEDMCLSTLANLAGWKFRFLRDIVAPAELPATVSAFKNQQSRWAMGSTQCVLKFSLAILTDEKRPIMARSYSLISMAGYSAQLLLLLLLLVRVRSFISITNLQLR